MASLPSQAEAPAHLWNKCEQVHPGKTHADWAIDLGGDSAEPEPAETLDETPPARWHRAKVMTHPDELRSPSRLLLDNIELRGVTDVDYTVDKSGRRRLFIGLFVDSYTEEGES